MTLHDPLWMQAGLGDTEIEYSAVNDRILIQSLFHDEGVFDTVFGSLRVTQRGAGANFSVDVAAGTAFIFGDDVAGQGMYMVSSDAVENVTIPAAPGAGTRTHRVVAQVKDKLHNSTDWSTYEWAVDVLEDDGSGTPAEPDSAITLATVAVAAGQVSVTDSDITDLREQACLITSKYPIVNADADRPVNPYESEIIWRLDKDCFEVYDGSAWREMATRDAGGSAWTTYTPAWTAATSNPSLGNGIRAGRYMRVGRTVHFVAEITMGSTTTFGSGTWSVGVPVTARTGAPSQTAMIRATDASTFQSYQGVGTIGTSDVSLGIQGSGADLDAINATSPVTWANGDILRVWGTYEAAS